MQKGLSDGYDWKFAECSDFGMKKNKGIGIGTGLYTQKCCFSTNENILTCNSLEDPDWSKHPVTINGNMYCDALNDYQTMIKVDIQGTFIKHSHTTILVILNCFIVEITYENNFLFIALTRQEANENSGFTKGNITKLHQYIT